MELFYYILVNDLKASQVLPDRSNIESLHLNNDYVIEKWKVLTKGSNFEFKYRIYKNGIDQDYIPIGDWKITKIRTSSSGMPKYLWYDLVDPKGHCSADRILPYLILNKNTEPALAVPSTGDTAFNAIFDLAKEATNYEDWLPFLINRAETNLSTIKSWRSNASQSEIDKLDKIINELKAKISSDESPRGH
jgi:hypothetical protein